MYKPLEIKCCIINMFDISVSELTKSENENKNSIHIVMRNGKTYDFYSITDHEFEVYKKSLLTEIRL